MRRIVHFLLLSAIRSLIFINSFNQFDLVYVMEACRGTRPIRPTRW